MHVTESMYPVLKGATGIMEAREELWRENGVESPSVQGGDIFIKSREVFHPLLTEHQVKKAVKAGNESPHHSNAKKMPVQQEPGREREGTGLSAAGVRAAGEPGKILKSSDEINQRIIEAMADPEAFMRELNITRLLNVDRNAEDLSRDAKQWLRRSKWRKDLREGKMPDLTQYPEGDAVPGKAFMKGYFETMLKPSKTPEMIRDMLRDEENAMLDWFIPLVRDEMEKACRPGASISDRTDWSIRKEQDPQISALVEKNTDDREVREKLLGTYEKKLKRAFKLATAIVRPDNLAFNMYRAESPSTLASDPYLYSQLNREL